jgi:putative ABC transport system substrate-binding protein
VAIEFRWAQRDYDRLPALATGLVNERVSVIVADGGGREALAAQSATWTIPIVFLGFDPTSLRINRLRGNAAGVVGTAEGLPLKGLDILHELIPSATTIALLVNPDTVGAEWIARDLRARSLIRTRGASSASTYGGRN